VRWIFWFLRFCAYGESYGRMARCSCIREKTAFEKKWFGACEKTWVFGFFNKTRVLGLVFGFSLKPLF
jgi:hypothetical protein